ncbi:type 1 glutamine amidotransferase [Necropsobacter massiliensis]|uniref:type 1 glutamine amidotransferase n=1 Tax=Necropsobacter massiliensis TaxID=1400001 RepID=UPI00059605EB|nr:type 1 glutamine amidotransferase [Necropsobacter massiliensis]
MHIHCIQHESFEAPGAYLDWAQARGYSISFSKVYENESLPESVEHIDLLLIMGGPQSPSSSKAEFPHFDSQAEQALIRRCIDAGKAVVGVCLGAQLIGEALGAAYGHSPEKEIGVFPIQLTAQGLQDPLINHFGDTLAVGHWHNDMPGLTADCQILATSAGCPRQIVRYTSKVYGFQCHMEITPEVASLLIASEPQLDQLSQQHPFVQRADEIAYYDYREMNEKLHQFLDKLIAS